MNAIVLLPYSSMGEVGSYIFSLQILDNYLIIDEVVCYVRKILFRSIDFVQHNLLFFMV